MREGFAVAVALLAGCAAMEASADLRLVHAIWGGDEDGLKAALRRGADPNVTLDVAYGLRPASNDAAWPTPLFLAIERRSSPELIRILLEAGADPDRRNHRGETPLSVVLRDEGQIGVSLVLLAAMKRLDGQVYGGCVGVDDAPLRTSYLHAAAGNLPVLQALVARGMSLRARDSAGQTPLHAAVRSKKVDTVRFLLERGADSEAKDHRGRTPFYWATRAPDLESLVELLIENPSPEEAARLVERAKFEALDPRDERDVELQCLLRSAASLR